MLYIKLFIEREKNTDQSAPECSFNDFQNGSRPPSWIIKICSFCHVAIVDMPFCFLVQNFTEFGQFVDELWPKKAIFKMATTAILNFKNFNFLSRDCHRVQCLMQCTKFHQNQTIFHGDKAILRFSKWRPSGMLDFKNFQFSSCSPCRHAVLLPHTKFRWNLTIGWWVMTKKAILKMAAAAVLNFKNFNFWSRDCHRVQYLLFL